MHKATFQILRLLTPVLLIAAVTTALAAPPAAEDRYIAARDAVIEKFSAVSDAGKLDDAAQKAEDIARADLETRMRAIVNETAREGFGPARLSLDSLYKGDEGFGVLDGLRFDALLGKSGEKAGANGADGKYVEPKAHIIVTTQTLFERWLHAHKEWWGDKTRNVPQQIGAALNDESLYTQAISDGAAVVKFSSLPIVRPVGATFAYAMLAGRTQDELPDAADEVIVAVIANGKVYIAEASIEPEVRIPACLADRKAEAADDNLRQKAEDAYARCFAQHAPQQPSFAQATEQARALLAAALGK